MQTQMQIQTQNANSNANSSARANRSTACLSADRAKIPLETKWSSGTQVQMERNDIPIYDEGGASSGLKFKRKVRLQWMRGILWSPQ
jgi:hypothetical protein